MPLGACKIILIEWAVLINLMDQSDWPDEEDAWLATGVRRDLHGLHVMVHLALLGNLVKLG